MRMENIMEFGEEMKQRIKDYCNGNITSFIPDIVRETDKNVFLLTPYKYHFEYIHARTWK